MSDIWTPDKNLPLGDLAYTDYGDLVDSLRRDLQLDASTDLLRGSVFTALSGLQIQWAVIDSRTPPPAIVSSSPGIQVGRSGVGRYVVTFGTPFKGNPAVVASTTWIAGTSVTNISPFSIAPTSTSIAVDNVSGTAAVDDYFTVIAVGLV